ncbi:uncharacterized protein LOC124448984 [Xenia sp. Carnegie-2017]|uniref:uncharacterized protein LOC124448984 n=1 Tax=Xenia sp. Carnegie-2017 TaxID=2897299 RepID=UPI001F03BF30|nr:uncharacterized protein LOC124448984 [Xenia sp. Carnegie-2017]
MMKRTVGRPSKYTFDVNAIVAAMSNVSGDQNDSYRKSNSFWGKILVELGIRNKLLARRNLYLRWHDNRNGMRSAIEHGRLELSNAEDLLASHDNKYNDNAHHPSSGREFLPFLESRPFNTHSGECAGNDHYDFGQSATDSDEASEEFDMVTTQKHLTGDIHYTKESEHGDASSIKQDSKRSFKQTHQQCGQNLSTIQ